DVRIPLGFLLYVHHHDTRDANRVIVNRRQLGILTQQLLLLATCRLAALKYSRELHRVGQELTRLDPVVQDARGSIGANDKFTMRKMESVHKLFMDITIGFNADTNTKSGLTYRIERSRYYVSQFLKKSKLLRIVRLDGDQPYHQFVERRLGAEFDYIESLGRRYERAVNAVLLLDQNYLAIKTNDTNNHIRILQEYGELALVGALL